MTTCCIMFRRTFTPVNRIAIVLAFYLLGLSLWPCADAALPPTGPDGCVVAATASRPGFSHEQHDQCTPFCICTCCAATITVASRFGYSLLPPTETMVMSVVAFAYTPIHWADSLSAIWQPPKVS